MMSVNATVRLRFRNRGTFFGLHVTATPFTLFYDDLTVASGEVSICHLYVLCCRFSCTMKISLYRNIEWKIEHRPEIILLCGFDGCMLLLAATSLLQLLLAEL
jgi:hypothetical protein